MFLFFVQESRIDPFFSFVASMAAKKRGSGGISDSQDAKATLNLLNFSIHG